MRPLLLAPALAFLFAHLPTAEEQLAFGVPKGAEVEKSFTLLLELSLAEQTQSFDGEEVVDMDESDLDMRVTSETKLVFRDEYREVAATRAQVLAREFLSLESVRTMRARGPDVDEEDTDEAESPLEGRTMVFTWSASEEAYACKYDGDGHGDEDLLADLVADSDFCAFLPEGPVTKGDSWTVEARHFGALWEPGGNLHLVPQDYREEAADRSRQIRANLVGELLATFEGVREEGGARLAVIALHAEVATHAETSGEDEDGNPTETRVRLAFDLEGTLLWELAAGHPHSYRISGDAEFTYDETANWDDDGNSHSLIQHMRMAGECTLTGTWRAEG